MIGSWEGPEVTGNAFQKLNLDQGTVSRNEVTGADHQVIGGEGLGERRSQRAPRSGGQYQMAGAILALRGVQCPFIARPLNVLHALFANFRSCQPSTLQQQSIQRKPRENREGMMHLKLHASSRRADQFAAAKKVVFNLCFSKEGILLQGLVRQSAAAWLFPRELFFKNQNPASTLCQQRRGQRSGRATSHNSDGILLLHVGIVMTKSGNTVPRPAIFTGVFAPG
jgi:hypothetical protein